MCSLHTRLRVAESNQNQRLRSRTMKRKSRTQIVVGYAKVPLPHATSVRNKVAAYRSILSKVGQTITLQTSSAILGECH